MPNGVIEEGKFVVAHERGKPKAELRQIRRHGIAVNAIEAALCHEPPRVQPRVLVRW